MEGRLWKVMGFWAMGLILFVATMIIIRWVVDFVTWSTLDSGWAQAFGSVFAIFATFRLFEKQREKEKQEARNNQILRVARMYQTLEPVLMYSTGVVMECVAQWKKGDDIAIAHQRIDEMRDFMKSFLEPGLNDHIVRAVLEFDARMADVKRLSDAKFNDDDLKKIANLEGLLQISHGNFMGYAQMWYDRCEQNGINYRNE